MRKESVLGNFVWRLLERFGAQGVTLIVSFVLARLLDPSIYGIVALITVITTFLQIFIDGGLGNSLIQKKDADDLDFSSVFYVNLVLGIALYVALFFLAPLISSFYNVGDLTALIRVVGLILIISSLKNVQQAYVSRHMMFKKFFFSTLAGTILAAVTGILLAIYGFGVWALVIQMLVNTFVDTLILWFTVGWKPKWMFSFKRVKGLLNFGWKLLLARLLSESFIQVKQLMVGKRYSKEDLAFYNQGEKIPSLIVTNINTSLDSVLFPTLSNEQDSKDNLRFITKKAITLCTFVLTPLMILLFICAEDLVRLVLTEKWLPCVPYLRIFCVVYMFYPIHTANLNAINALGKSSTYLILEIIKVSLGMLAIIIAMNFGPLYIAIAYMLTSIVAVFINSIPNSKYIKYGPLNQLMDAFPNYIMSFIVGLVVYKTATFLSNSIISLIYQIIVFIVLYVFLAYITKNSNFKYTFELLKSFLNKSKKEKEND